MKKLMAYKDGDTILEAISNRKIISDASENLVTDDVDLDVFVKMVSEFLITLDTNETLAILAVLDPVIYNLGDLPSNTEDIPEMVYQEFVDRISNDAGVNCVKAYETLASVIEIVESDLDEEGLTMSEADIMTLAIVEMIYTATDTVLTQVWDDAQMAASSSNIPDRDTVEQVEPKEQVEKIEKIPEDQVEVIDESKESINLEETKKADEKSEMGEITKAIEDIFKDANLTKEQVFNMSVDDIMKLDVIDKVIDCVVDEMGLGHLRSVITGKTSDSLNKFMRSMLEDLISEVKKENAPKDSPKRIEEKPHRANVVSRDSTSTQVNPSASKVAFGTAPIRGVNKAPKNKTSKYDSNTRLEISMKFDNGQSLAFYGSPDRIAENVKEHELKYNCRVLPGKISTTWGDPISLDYHKTYKFSNGDVETFTGSDYIIDYLVKEYERCNHCKVLDKVI